MTYSNEQAARDYIRDLISDLRVTPSPMWPGAQWPDYQRQQRQRIAELFSRRNGGLSTTDIARVTGPII